MNSELSKHSKGLWQHFISATILLLLMCILILLIRQGEDKSYTPSNQHLANQERDYANILQGQGLYKKAIEAYRRYLTMSRLEADKQANIHYLIANMYREKLHNYEEAMAEYLRVKQLSPKSTLIPEINRKIVECLERMDRSLDAQRTLTKAAALKKKDREKTKAVNVVAKIGDRLITLQDLNDEVQKLPPSLQKTYTSSQEKLQFLKQYVAKEILFDTAMRRGYDQDPVIREDLDRLRKELMVQRLISEEIKAKVHISEAERRLYFETHKDKYQKDTNKTPGVEPNFASLQAQIEADLQKEKEQIAYQELIQKALTAHEVEIFDYYFIMNEKNGVNNLTPNAHNKK